MNSHANNFNGKAAAVLVVALLMASSLTVLNAFSNDADAAVLGTDLSNLSIVIYDETSENYSSLAYLGTELPVSINPAQWTMSDGYWYNIDRNSPDNGKVLTYGMLLGAVDLEDIRSDVLAKYSALFTGTEFRVLQVAFTSVGESTYSYVLSKSGESLAEESGSVAPKVGNYLCNSVGFVRLYTLGTGGDIEPSDLRGTYSVSLSSNGQSYGFVRCTYSSGDLVVSGKVTDTYGLPVPGARVVYSRTDAKGDEIFTVPTIRTLSDGTFDIPCEYGGVITVRSIEAQGYTFSDASNHLPYCTGTVTADKSGLVFAANEKTLCVRALDLSGNPVAKQNLSAVWYYQMNTAANTWTIYSSSAGLTVIGSTDENGCARITYTDPSYDDYRLYVSGPTTTDRYDFPYDDSIRNGATFTVSAYDYSLSQSGNIFIDLSDEAKCQAQYTDGTYSELSITSNVITASQYSVKVPVCGGPASGSLTAPIADVALSATWYFEVENSGEYRRCTINNISPSVGLVSAGRVYIVPAAPGDTSTTVVFTHPEWDDNPKVCAYLYVAYSSGARLYSFDLPSSASLASGTDNLVTIAGACGGCVAYRLDNDGTFAAPTVTSVHSENASFEFTGTVTGDIPSDLIAYCELRGIDTSSLFEDEYMFSVPADSGSFSLSIPEGAAVYISLNTGENTPLVTRYEFSNTGWTSSTVVDGSQSFSSVSRYVSDNIARAAPVLVRTYTVNALNEGDQVEFVFRTGGNDIDVVLECAGGENSVVCAISGWNSYSVTNMTVYGVNVFVPEFGSLYAVNAMVTKQTQIVTYVLDGTGVPQTADVVGDQVVRMYVDGVRYGTDLLTSALGTASFLMPEGADIQFKLVRSGQEYSLTYSIVTSGPFEGLVALNLDGIVNAQVPITITVGYSSSSSLDNLQAPVMTPIVMDPVDYQPFAGEKLNVSAPALEGFRFAGWFLGAERISEQYNCSLDVLPEYDHSTLTAVYSPLPPEPEEQSIDSTTLMIGLVAIAIAIMAFAYVIIQNRGY